MSYRAVVGVILACTFSLAAITPSPAQDSTSSGLGSLVQQFISPSQPNGPGSSLLGGAVKELAGAALRKITGQPAMAPPRAPYDYYDSHSRGSGYAPASDYGSAPGSVTVRIPDLNRQELNVLARHDVAVLVDRSRSMLERDCPPGQTTRISSLLGRAFGAGAISRWQWAEDQIANLHRQASGALRDGITLVLFSNKPKVHTNVRLDEIPSIFASNPPSGGTNMARALEEGLDDYFARKHRSGGAARPLAIAVITDGVPDSQRALRNVIVKATHRMTYPGEIKITFLQVGHDPAGGRFVRELDDRLTGDGAAADIVDSKSFAELTSTGLPRAIAQAISQSENPVSWYR